MTSFGFQSVTGGEAAQIVEEKAKARLVRGGNAETLNRGNLGTGMICLEPMER